MPFRTADPVLTIEESRMRNIDPQNPENLFGMWSVFHKCAGIIENGRRLENLSWRVFAHETLCVSSTKRHKRVSPSFSQHNQPQKQTASSMPALSTSVDSSSSVEFEDIEDDTVDDANPNNYYRHSFGEHSSNIDQVRIRGDKHITPLDLENLVISIKAKQHLTGPLSPLPLPSPSLEEPPVLEESQEEQLETKKEVHEKKTSRPTQETPRTSSNTQDTAPTPRPSSPRHVESSTSTIETDATSPSPVSPSLGSETSAESDLSHSVVRGFRTGNRGVSTYRSQSQLHLAPTPSQTTPRDVEQNDSTLPRKKGGMFQLGGSLTEDEASLRDQLSPESQGSLRTGSMRHTQGKKHASFLEKVVEIPRPQKTFMLSTSQDDGNAIESDDEEFDTEEEVSESAIEDDDDWEDEEAESPEDGVKKLTFARVDSKPNLVSRRSIITEGLHESQRASALQNAASRSTPLLRRSRNSTPNGPSMPASLEDHPQMEMMISPSSNSNQIMLPAEDTLAPAVIPLSPRATRRNMLTSELGVSLRKHMLNERQQRNIPYPTSTTLPRRHTSHNVQNLTQYPEPADSRTAGKKDPGSRNNSWTDYFDYGMGEYHQKGW